MVSSPKYLGVMPLPIRRSTPKKSIRRFHNRWLPDHTMLARRSKGLGILLCRSGGAGPIHLIVDSTGLSIAREGGRAAAKHGGKGRRGWRKLQLGVDGVGVIVALFLTGGNVDAAAEGIKLLRSVDRRFRSFTGDGAYDSVAVYTAAGARRDRAVGKIPRVGRRRRKTESGYLRQGRAENAFFRFKSIVGGQVCAR